MEVKRWRGIPLQLFVIIVLPLTLLLLLIAFGSLLLHQRAMRSLVGVRDERAVRAASTAITEQINHRLTAVRSLAYQASESDSPQHALDDAAYFLPDFDGGLALFTGDGMYLAASGDLDFWQSELVTRQLQQIMADARFQQDPRLATTMTHPLTAQPIVLVVSAVEAGSIAAGAFSPVSLANRVLSDLFDEGQAIAFIIDRDGRLLYQAGDLTISTSELRQHPGVAEALQGGNGTSYVDFDGEEHVVAFASIPGVNWALIIEEPWRSVTDPLLATTELTPLVLAPALIVALVAIWFGVRQIMQPLQTLEQKASALGWGNFDPIKEPVGGISEIRRLQTELIHMAQKVQAAQQSLRGYLSAITMGQEEERRRLARDIHDDTIQSLIALNQQVQLAQMSANDQPTDRLVEMQQMITQIIADLRRFSQDLRPIYLEDLGLIPALDMLARDVDAETHITFHTQGTEKRLPGAVELALYRIVQEALSNIARHAGATNAHVQLDFAPEAVTLTVSDDGCGFNVPDSPAEMAPAGHFGLLGVKERAELIGARLLIESAPEVGTRVTITLPV